MAPRLNIPPITRALLLSLFAFTVLNAAARYRSWSQQDRSASPVSRQYYAPYLTIIPAQSIIYPYVFLSSTFAEQNLFGLLITGGTLFYGGRYLERAWSSREYIKFFLLISVVPNVLTFVIYFLLFVLTGHEGLASTSICGGIAIQAAFLVSFKQLVPEHTVSLARNLIRARVKHFPAIFLLSNTISGLAFGTDTAMVLAWLGFLVAWVYLRFYRISPSSASTSTGEGATLRGDASDTFAFACFFPEAVQPPVAAIADAVHSTLVSLKVCTPFSDADVDAGNTQASARGDAELPSLLNPGSRGGGGGRREEAERRRALALRALDQRLHAASVKPSAVTMPSGPSPLGETTYEPDPEPGRPRSREGAQ